MGRGLGRARGKGNGRLSKCQEEGENGRMRRGSGWPPGVELLVSARHSASGVSAQLSPPCARIGGRQLQDSRGSPLLQGGGVLRARGARGWGQLLSWVWA